MQDVSKRSLRGVAVALIAAGAILAAPAFAAPAAEKTATTDQTKKPQAKSSKSPADRAKVDAAKSKPASKAAKDKPAKSAQSKTQKGEPTRTMVAQPQARPKLVSVPIPQSRPGAEVGAAAPAPAGRPMQLVDVTPATAPVPRGTEAFAQAGAGARGAVYASRAVIKPLARPAAGPFAVAPTTVTSDADIAAVRRVKDAAAKGNDAEADAAARSIGDPVARKLAEYMILRSFNTKPNFERYANFIERNPDWPHVPMFRRRAENTLWNDNVSDAGVMSFFAHQRPTTAKGRYVLARALLARGDRAAAQELVRTAWRTQDASADVERKVLDMFSDMLTREDHQVRMDDRFYNDDTEGGMRAAERIGGVGLQIAKAWTAVLKRAKNAKALLDAVPASAHRDPGYIFARAQWLRKNGKPEEAGKLILTAPKDPAALVDVNEWWQERRILVRDLLDNKDAQTAYRVAREAATPTQANYRVDKHFTAGWIALRFLHDPKTAAAHFAEINRGAGTNPHALSRGGYWQGRAAEAMGQQAQARSFYAEAAQYSATYYGQLARARVGLPDIGLVGPPNFNSQERGVLASTEVVRAVELLYALDERDMIASIYAEIGDSGTDVAGMAMLGEVAAKHKDPRAMVLLGKNALGRGLPLDHYAFPIAGLPSYQPIAPPVEDALVYSIARQESHFNQKVVSPAKAMGFMQVTPVAAQDTSKRFKYVYNSGRLLTDPVYNMQMGAAELSMLLSTYDGSYIMTFAGYNAGRGRVRQWVAAYGDPRDPNVDPVDWCERIPIAETRNYVQRIMENMQVYRARFGGGNKLVIEADLRRGAPR
ncbi:lytic transglycosylase domain-containing protein [Undibacter mobilis]|uniref:Lytic transglycosylase domain-containing protein n=1 Tax=Undibacter mobilis TaxID=2292256 RepID=A0A371B1K6_9BRAD|nr:lytic transglycosylase domain-containing protein [Undibacter mobilis]RDV01394.1 lytic transglycosylase domain-containing protein [Undibacter mobilis]